MFLNRSDGHFVCRVSHFYYFFQWEGLHWGFLLTFNLCYHKISVFKREIHDKNKRPDSTERVLTYECHGSGILLCSNSV